MKPTHIARTLALALTIAALPALAIEATAPPVANDLTSRLQSSIDGPQRSAENRARDVYRHPLQTLQFFGLRGTDTVIEITPGGGWFTEVLAPVLKDSGRLIVLMLDPTGLENQRLADYLRKSNAKFREKLAADPTTYGEVEIIEAPVQSPALGPAASVDAVYTFRNVHNWTGWGSDAAMFKAFFAVLKPNGVLGVEEHRAVPGSARAKNPKSGYLTEDYVIGLATAAGFTLEARNEINANSKDVDDHPNGVWTLPPSNAHEPAEAAKYQAIGESDRMTLRFRKPRA